MPITPNQISFAAKKDEAVRWQCERAGIWKAMSAREEIPLNYHELV